MQIIGHGVDLTELEEIRHQIDNYTEHFIGRCFTENESKEAEQAPDRYAYYAGRFAAKEAVMKAMGLVFGEGISFSDIEIKKATSGAPEVILHKIAAEHAKKIGIEHWLLSISHTSKNAIASALAINSL